MEYKLMMTLNGPVVVGEDEVVYFHEYGPLQDYIDLDPKFFAKAFEFLSNNMREQSGMLLQSIEEEIPGHDWLNRFNTTYAAAMNLKQFQFSQQPHQH
jgi:hypothetical protein